MKQQVPLNRSAVATDQHGANRATGPDLAYQRLAIVNVIYYGAPGAGDRQWVLIDAGMTGTAPLIADAGDAFITTNQESAFAVAVQKPEIHGPPMYYTPDWVQARQSVERLAALKPELVVTGHGPAMEGPEMQQALQTLARDFAHIAVPEHGRYVPPSVMAEAVRG